MTNGRYEVEYIPDDHKIYLRVNGKNCRQKNGMTVITPSAVKPVGSNGLSTDWSKYSTCIESKNRAKVAGDNGILSADVSSVRENVNFEVVHDPLDDGVFDNQAHSLVKGVPEYYKKEPESNERLREEVLACFEVCLQTDNYPAFTFEIDN